jgi:hypothetical protein
MSLHDALPILSEAARANGAAEEAEGSEPDGATRVCDMATHCARAAFAAAAVLEAVRRSGAYRPRQAR